MPNLDQKKAIKKFIIYAGIKITGETKICYPEKQKYPKFKNNYPVYNFFIVEYSEARREWYLTYVTKEFVITKCTIDDITGSVHLMNNLY